MTCSFGMDHPLWDSFTVEVCHLISEDEVLEKDRPSGTHSHSGRLQTHRCTCSSGQHIFLLKSNDCDTVKTYLHTLQLQKPLYCKHTMYIFIYYIIKKNQNNLQSDKMTKPKIRIELTFECI